MAIEYSFSAACGMTALLLTLESFPEDERIKIKSDLISSWKRSWSEVFQAKMQEYNKTLSKVSNSHLLSQPEDFQEAFNKAISGTETSIRKALAMEVK
jgi:hypothetical protein